MQPDQREQISSQPSAGRRVMTAALLIAAGNLLSRLVALGREQVIAAQFSTGPDISLFKTLYAIPTLLYDMLAGGLISAALIPVLSEYAEQDEQEFWRIAGSVLSLVLLVLAGLSLLIGLLPGFFSTLLAADLLQDNPQLVDEAQTILHMMLVAVLFMGLRGLSEALLQSQRRFLLPALSTSLFNVGIIVAALLFASLGVTALALGMVLGAAAQVLVQLPGLRLRQLRPRLELRHPAVRRIGALYLPVAVGMSFSMFGTTVDRRLANATGDFAVAVMSYATTLIQLTLGLIAAAVGLAILPTLSRLSAAADEAGFRRMFGLGLSVVLMLIMPAMVLLAVLATPVTRLIFQYGRFTEHDTALTALALLLYLPSLLFAAVDQLLLFAFYARKNTLLPNLVQGAAIACYLLVALLSYRQFGMYGLIVANVLQHLTHMLIMLLLGQRQLGLLRGERLGEALWKISLASAAAGALALGLAWLLRAQLGTTALSSLLQVLLAGGLGGLVYILLLLYLKLAALAFFWERIAQRLGRRGVPREKGTF